LLIAFSPGSLSLGGIGFRVLTIQRQQMTKLSLRISSKSGRKRTNMLSLNIPKLDFCFHFTSQLEYCLHPAPRPCCDGAEGLFFSHSPHTQSTGTLASSRSEITLDQSISSGLSCYHLRISPMHPTVSFHF
jgi:hypothetical protein